MGNDFKGKTVVVTGASRGIGRAVAEKFAEGGANLVISARSIDLLNIMADEFSRSFNIKVLPVKVDLTSLEEIENMVKKTVDFFGGIHVLVNNTGGPPPGFFMDFDDNGWYNAFTLNLMSIVRTIRLVVPFMMEQKWGRIINLVSVAVKSPIPNLVLSNTIRSAIPGLTVTLAGELASYGILINNVCPGYTLTERVEELAKNIASRENISISEVKKRWTASIPLGRMAEPSEIAKVVYFLATEGASYITGQSITVDGGFHKGLF